MKISSFHRSRPIGFALTGLTILIASGCTKPAPALAPTKPAEVYVENPVIRTVTDYEDFTGRTEAVVSVEVRSRVAGYLNKIHFKDGIDVKEGDLLFEIDPRTYAATLEQAKANEALAKARLDRVQRDYDRISSLSGSTAITREELDRVIGDRAEAAASLNLAKASKVLAETNLNYTKITSPVSGRISRRMIDAGNLVRADDTPLTTVVALDRIYATFDIDERTLLRIRRLVREGKVDSARSTKVEIQVGLADEEGFSHTGVIDFIDNKVDAATGTLRVRATLENPKLLLSPGLFIRVRIPVGRAHSAVLVPEESLASDQGQKYVYVVNDKDEVIYRRVKIGQPVGRDRVVTEGLEISDRVITTGLQRVRPGAKVSVKTAESIGKSRPPEKEAVKEAAKEPEKTPEKTETPKKPAAKS
jgi:RND family efflux transporter MFP subunit